MPALGLGLAEPDRDADPEGLIDGEAEGLIDSDALDDVLRLGLRLGDPLGLIETDPDGEALPLGLALWLGLPTPSTPKLSGISALGLST
jgi:hypothetical protein